PVEGVVMGTRCGNIDAGIITYLQAKYGMDEKAISNVLNKKSGFLGVSGISSDARDVEAAAEGGNTRAQLTLDMFRYSVIKYIGAYAAAMNGVDLIVFTGGIGENDPDSRRIISTGCSFLGIEFDSNINKGLRGKDVILTKPQSKVVVAAVTTNEELVIAQETMRLTVK
ncbi:MAG: acetate kinase, partial [Bacteroidales bacterium]